MRRNALRAKWERGEPAVVGQCSIGSPHVAEVMARQGYDAIMIDQQHAAIDYLTAFSMLQAIATTGTPAMVRVAWNAPQLVMQALDAGAYGVVCPMVNSREECAAFVGAAKYAPRGYRSWGPVRALHHSEADGETYAREANDTILTIAMIETSQAMARIDEILATEGLDGIFIGPSDLSISLGYAPPARNPDAPVVRDALHAALAAARRHGIIAGVNATTPEFAAEMISAGFDYVILGADIQFIAPAAQASLRATRRILAGEAVGG